MLKKLLSIVNAILHCKIMNLMKRIICKIIGVHNYEKIVERVFIKVKMDIFRFVNNRKSLLWNYEIEKSENEPLISIIVPCYNHEKYLKQRLDSIYGQTYKNYEVILLDDCSDDNSKAILNKYAQMHKDNTRVFFNEKQSGRVFFQWQKGISKAKGQYIWIAESDDYCESNFLEEMIKCFKYDSVMLAFSKTVFVEEINGKLRKKDFVSSSKVFNSKGISVISAADAVYNEFSYYNMIPNASGVVFKNIKKLSDEVVEVCSNMNLCSDWVFYLGIICGGSLAYTSKTKDYYRIHNMSTSKKVQKTIDYYKEREEVSRYIAHNYIVSDDCFEKNYEELIRHYKELHGEEESIDIKKYYNIDKLNLERKKRKPNIAMACFSLQMGGGETYPLYLANELKNKGYPITVLDFNCENYQEEIRNLLLPSVPLVRLKHLNYFYLVSKHDKYDIVHSHHGSIDKIIATNICQYNLKCKHFITLHGMYEAIDEKNCMNLMRITNETCQKYIYIADKNLAPFKKWNYYIEEKFVKIPNGLPMVKTNTITREEIGIGKDDFTLCLVSRGIKEKGWKEAIEAVNHANEISNRKIHLIIVGDGEARRELEKKSSEYIHFMGVRNNVRDYFSLSDAGILPTYFKGESYPLVLIECLQCNRPMIITDIAEVKQQLQAENGEIAGILLPFVNEKVQVDHICNAIIEISENNNRYSKLKELTYSAMKKFDISNITDKYLEEYYKVLKGETNG